MWHLLFTGPSVKYDESLCYCELTGMTGVKMLRGAHWRPKFASWNIGHKLKSEINQLILYSHLAGNPSTKPVLFLQWRCPLPDSLPGHWEFSLFFWLHWIFAAVYGLSVVAHGLLLLWSMGSRACGFSICGTQTSLVVVYRLSYPMTCGILAPQPGIKATSSALEGRFSTTGPPGKSRETFLILHHDSII